MSSQNEPVYLRIIIRDLDDNNEVFFSNEDTSIDPLEIVPGAGQFFPKIDALLLSMKVGERKTMTLEKEDAFGNHMPEAIKKIPLDKLPEELRKIGTDIVTQMENGDQIQGTVIELEEEFAVVDFNHPLAGKTIEIEFVLVEK